jgi:hypothetical protein
MAIKGVTYELPIENGSFIFSSGVDRMERAVDFLISFWDVNRLYKEFFSTLFLRAFIQSPSSSDVAVLRPLIVNRFTRLMQSEVSEINVSGAGIGKSRDRKVFELSVSYEYVPESVTEAPISGLTLTRFL